MDFAYRFRDPDRLYLNVTNRCTNRCEFCVRTATDGLGDGRLRGGPEPTLDELLAAVHGQGGAESLAEIVWCGFGEPTHRLDLILAASPRFRDAGCRVRLNTNGHANLIHGRDVLPELVAAVDLVSVSLNAADAQRYTELCRPDLTALGADRPETVWQEVLDCIARSAGAAREVHASVVGHVLERHEIEACRRLAFDLGCDGFRVR
jgi:TatD DNase family protein